MTSTKSSPRPKEKASSDAKEQTAVSVSKFRRNIDLEELLSRDPLDYDLLTQLTHMSAVSTSGMSRSKLFEGTASISASIRWVSGRMRRAFMVDGV